MKKLIAMIAGLGALAACETAPLISTTPSAELVQSFMNQDSKSGLLIVDAQSNLGCDSFSVYLSEPGNSTRAALRQVTIYDKKESAPAILHVAPGTYEIRGVYCNRYGYYPTEMNGVRYWFHTVEVEEGEAVYMGTLDVDVETLQTRQKTGQAIANFLLMTDLDGRNDHQYPIYSLVDDEKSIAAYLDENHPGTSSKLVTRMPYQIVDPESIRTAYQNAYARNEDGSMPTREEAMGKLKIELDFAYDAAKQKYLDELKARLEQYREDQKLKESEI